MRAEGEAMRRVPDGGDDGRVQILNNLEEVNQIVPSNDSRGLGSKQLSNLM